MEKEFQVTGRDLRGCKNSASSQLSNQVPVSQSSAQFQGIQRVNIPPRVYRLCAVPYYLVPRVENNPQRRCGCAHQASCSFGASQLSSLALIYNTSTASAPSSSYRETSEHLTQAQEASGNPSAVSVKPKGPASGKAPEPNASELQRKSVGLVEPAEVQWKNTQPRSAVYQRPCRDRVMHLLALRSYKKPELLARLQRDGISQKDKNSVETILQEVAQLNPKDNSYMLKDCLFKDIQKDWPGYSETERGLLQLILPRKLVSSQNVTSTRPVQPPVAPNSAAPSTSSQNLPQTLSVVNPQMNKKQSIAYVAAQVSLCCHGHASKGRGTLTYPRLVACAAVHQRPAQWLPAATPRQTVVFKPPGTPAGQKKEYLVMKSFSPNIRSTSGNRQQKNVSLNPSGTPVVPMESPKPVGEKPVESQQEPEGVIEYQEDDTEMQDTSESESDKEEEEETASPEKLFSMDACEGLEEPFFASQDPSPSTSNQPDYIHKYVCIVSYEQRQSYEKDFRAEYDEYRILSARMMSISSKFGELAARCRSLSSESKQYKDLQDEIVAEYQKLKQTNPGYSKEKIRCEYLHDKLSHIKKLIREFDSQTAKQSQ